MSEFLSSGIDGHFSEAQQMAAWFQAKQERDQATNPVDSEVREEVMVDASFPEGVIESTMPAKDSRGELYQGIIDGGRFVKPDQANKGAKIPIRVLGDNIIRVGDKDIVLEDHKLYVFNTLLLTRHPATATSLRSLGFDPEASGTDFARAIASLGNTFKRAIGFDLIGNLSKGKQRLFVLNPNVVVSDGRRIKNILTASNERSSDSAAERTSIGAEYDEVAEFETNSKRDLAIRNLLTRYRMHPRVLQKINEFKVKGMPTGSTSDVQQYFNFAEQFKLLNGAEEKALFSFIEAGLAAYQELPDFNHPPPEKEKALINLAIAHQVLQFSNFKLVAYITPARHKRLLFCI